MVKAERIIDSRRLEGKPYVEYWVKWKGRPHSMNTWVPDNNLDCRDLIQKFEVRRRDMDKPTTFKRRLSKSNEKDRRCVTKKVLLEPSKASGSDLRLEAEKILGATTQVVQEPSGANGSDRRLEAEKILGATTQVIQEPSAAKGSDVGLQAKQILGATTQVVQKPSGANGLERILEAEKILGAVRSNGELYYITKIKDVDPPECVHNSVAHASFNDMVTGYLEENMIFSYSDDESDPPPAGSLTTKPCE